MSDASKKASRRRYSNATNQRRARRLKAQATACWLCGGPFDPEPHGPWSFSVDHVVPLSLGGSLCDFASMRPAHRECNTKRADALPLLEAEAKERQRAAGGGRGRAGGDSRSLSPETDEALRSDAKAAELVGVGEED